MTEVDSCFLDANTYVAKFLRMWMRQFLTEGVIGTNDLLVTEKGTPDMSVDIAAGWGLVQGDQATSQGHYPIYNDDAVNKAIAASDPTHDRIDRVVAQIKDSTDIGGVDDEWELQVLTGTPAGSPSAPALPDDALDLALVDVGAGVTTIVDANITDQRTVFALQNLTIDADTLDSLEGATLKANEIIVMADGFKIDGSSCELSEDDGTAAKCYIKNLAVAKTEWFDVPKFRVPDTYDGGDIVINVCFRSAGASKTHSLGIRVASVATGEAHNPDTAAAYQLYDEEASDADIGEIKIKSVTVTQANHLMVAGEIWHCKFVMEDDAGADADDVLIDWVVIEWNKS